MIELQTTKHRASDKVNNSGLQRWGQVIDYHLIDRQCEERIRACASRIFASRLSGFGKGHLNT